MRFKTLAAAVGVLATIPVASALAEFPEREITMIVNAGSGGSV